MESLTRLIVEPEAIYDRIYRFPSWMQFLSNLGRTLDSKCGKQGIASGRDYIITWIASLLKHPERKLPYLYIHGPSNSGKSMFYKSLRLLLGHRVITGLVVCYKFRDTPLNGAVEQGELMYMEHPVVQLDELQRYVANSYLKIHHLTEEPKMVPNRLHFVQISESPDDLPPIEFTQGVTHIETIALKHMTARNRFLKELESEAGTFLAYCLQKDVPSALLPLE